MAITGVRYKDGKGTYRKGVPEHLRSYLDGRTEFNKTVKTATKGEAERSLLPFIADVAEQLEAAARQYKPEQVEDLSEEQAVDLARGFHREFQADWLDGERSVGRITDDDLLTSRREEPDGDIVRLSAEMTANDYSSVSPHVDHLLQDNGIELTRGSAAHRLLLEYVMRALIDCYRWEAKRLKGDFSQAGRDPLFADTIPDPAPRNRTPSPQVGASRPVSQGVTLQQLVRRYSEAPERRQLAPKTKMANVVAGRVLGEVLGNDTNILDVNREACRAVQGLIMRLPPNSTKKFPNRSLKWVADHADAKKLKRMSPKTVNSYMMKVSALFKWAVQEQLLPSNPAAGLLLPDTGPQNEDRNPFTVEQLNAIFRLPVFTGCKSERSFTVEGPNVYRNATFWAPLISTFTGLRANEIGALNVTNVLQKDGIWTFEVTTTDTEDKRVKNAQSVRLIPVHRELVEVGFLEYHRETIRSGHTKLFPDLRLDASGYYSRRISDHFSRMLVRGALKKPRQSFHSFRHNFRDIIRHGLIDDRLSGEVAKALGGWKSNEDNGVADSVYGDGFTVDALAKKMALIGYDGLDLTHLKK